MIDKDLLGELESAARKVGRINLLSEDEALERVRNIAKIYVADSGCRWWWQSLVKPGKRIKYDGSDGLSTLAKLAEPECKVILVVTDDNDPPWPVYSGQMSGIIEVLQECRFFEFFLAADDGEWIIFDTHMNELIIARDVT